MEKVLYIKSEWEGVDDYYPMQKVEWEENEAEDAKCWDARYNDKTGELVWVEMK